MGLGCNYVLLDAQTIQMVKVDEAKGNKGSLGRQFIMQAVAQVCNHSFPLHVNKFRYWKKTRRNAACEYISLE